MGTASSKYENLAIENFLFEKSKKSRKPKKFKYNYWKK